MATTPNMYPMWDAILEYIDFVKKLSSTSSQKTLKLGINPEFITVLSNYLHNLYTAQAEGKPIMMYNFCIPPELIYTLGMYPACQEVGSVALSGLGRQHLKYIDLAEENGISPEQCNAQKIWIGAIMAEEIFKPDGIIYASQPCDSTNILYQVIENWYHIPTYTIDVPYWAYKPDSNYYDERTLPYFTTQLKGFIPWAEKNFGVTLNIDQLKKVMALSNQARELTLEINELMKMVPAPLPSMTTFSTYVTLTTSAGTQEAVDYCGSIRDKAADMVKHKTGAYHKNYGKEEKFRVVWIYIPIFWDMMLYNWMERKFGAVIVQDLMGYHLGQPVDISNEETIFEGLAKSILDIPMGAQSRGPAEYYIDYLVHIVNAYKADCAIYGGHMGCKHSWGIATLLKEELYKATGVPTLLFEVDTMDPRLVNTRMVKQKLKVFFTEMM